MRASARRERTPVIAYEEDCTILYPSIHEAGRAYNLSCTQIRRLIENEQNIAHTQVYLDYAIEGPKIRGVRVFFNGEDTPVDFQIGDTKRRKPEKEVSAT